MYFFSCCVSSWRVQWCEVPLFERPTHITFISSKLSTIWEVKANLMVIANKDCIFSQRPQWACASMFSTQLCLLCSVLPQPFNKIFTDHRLHLSALFISFTLLLRALTEHPVGHFLCVLPQLPVYATFIKDLILFNLIRYGRITCPGWFGWFFLSGRCQPIQTLCLAGG